jgi:two-component sensor histidine kinase
MNLIRITLFTLFTILNLIKITDSYALDSILLKSEKEIYDLGYHLEILEDKTNKLTFDKILKKTNIHFKISKDKVPNFGSSNSSFWIKFSFENIDHPSNEWMLSFEQVWCDYIDFYKKIGNKWEVIKTGDRTKFKTRDVKNRNFVFKIRPGKKSTYYIRIKTNDGVQIPLKLYSASSFAEEESWSMIGFGLFYGIMFVMIVYNFFIFISTRSLSYLYYILYISFYTLLNMATNGLGFQFLYPSSIWFQNEGFLCRASILGVSLIYFTMNYLGVNDSTPKIKKIFTFYLYTAILFFIFSFFPIYKLLIGPFYLFLGTGFVYLLFVGGYKVQMNYRPAKYYIFAFVFLISGALFQIIQINTPFLPSWFIFTHGFQIGGVIEVILLSLGLADIINILLEENVKANKQLEEANLNLEEKVMKRTTDLSGALSNISSLLDNMRQAVFTVSEGGKIQSPVSKFSSSIFEDNIVGRNIFENIYLCLDPKSEIYSTIQFSLGIIFGADDLQWEMVKDHFPTRVEIFFSASGNKKILKVACNPLFNNENLLERLMFVVEDITEIEELEKEMEEQKKASMKNLQILQELANNKKDDLSEFFNSTQNMAMECLFLSKVIRSQVEKSEEITDIGLLFRQLHTIKGNARVYGLSLISAKAHHSENALSGILNENNDDFIIDYDQINNLVQELYGLQGQINEYVKAAKDVFALEFKEDLKFKEKLHDLTKSLEYWVSKLPKELKDRNNSQELEKIVIDSIKKNEKKITYIEELENLSHSLKGLARGMDERDLSQNIHLLETGLSYLKNDSNYTYEQFKEYLIFPLKEIRNMTKNIFVKSSQFNGFETNNDSWVQILKEVFFLSKIINSDELVNHDDLSQKVYNLHAKSLNFNLEFLPSMFRLMYDFVEEKSFNINQVNLVLKEVWSFLLMVIELDCYKNLDKNGSKILLGIFRERKELKSDFEIEGQTVLVPFLLDLQKNGENLEGFFNTLSFILKKKKKEIIEELFSSGDVKEFINEVYYEILNSNYTESFDKLDRIFSFEDYSFIGKLKEYILNKDFSWHFYTKIIDILKLLKQYSDIEDFKESDLKPKTFEIIEENFLIMKNTMNALQDNPTEDVIQSTHLAFKNLLDQPLKYSLVKYRKVVKEIAENLGKKINFKLTGDQCSINKNILNILQDIMVHLVRNAVDHGIEKQEKRLLKGKEEIGTIEIICKNSHHNSLTICIKDDGQGINVKKIGKKSVSLGFITQEKLNEMSYEDKLNLIFLPSLTTKEGVTEISGRGIGMDVVKKGIASLGGDFKIDTEPDQGTTFTIILEKDEAFSLMMKEKIT